MENQPLPVRDMWVDRVETAEWLPVASLPKKDLDILLPEARVNCKNDACCKMISQYVDLDPLSVWIQKVHPKKDMKLRPQTPFRAIILHFMIGSDVVAMIKNGERVLLCDGFMDMFNLAIYPNEATLEKNKGFTSLHINIQPKDLERLIKLYPSAKALNVPYIMLADGPVNKEPIAINEMFAMMMGDIFTCRYVGVAAHFFMLRTSVNMLIMFEKLMRRPKKKLPDVLLKKVEKCFSFLDAYYMGQHTRKQLSAMIGINAHALQEGFEAVYGCTTDQFQYRMRMNTAYRTLVETNTPIERVAEMMGFKSTRSFRISFRKYFTCDPIRLMNAQ